MALSLPHDWIECSSTQIESLVSCLLFYKWRISLQDLDNIEVMLFHFCEG